MGTCGPDEEELVRRERKERWETVKMALLWLVGMLSIVGVLVFWLNRMTKGNS